MTKNKHPTIHMCREIDENVCKRQMLQIHVANEKVRREVKGYHVTTTGGYGQL